jgi:hypothetical protein
MSAAVNVFVSMYQLADGIFLAGRECKVTLRKGSCVGPVALDEAVFHRGWHCVLGQTVLE